MTEDAAPSEETRHERGRRTLERIHPEVGASVVERLQAIAPDFARQLVEYPFGDIYSRPGLDLRSRQIATIAALTTLGGSERELRWHVRGGLNVGLTRAEIVEVIMQMAVYAGFPRAIQALDAAKEAFDQIDEAVEVAEEAARQDDA
jgi:4-carboxymuconolactone decarboxylase